MKRGWQSSGRRLSVTNLVSLNRSGWILLKTVIPREPAPLTVGTKPIAQAGAYGINDCGEAAQIDRKSVV